MTKIWSKNGENFQIFAKILPKNGENFNVWAGTPLPP